MKKSFFYTIMMVLCASIGCISAEVQAANLYKIDGSVAITAQDNQYRTLAAKQQAISVKGDKLSEVLLTGEGHKDSVPVKKIKDASFTIVENLIFPAPEPFAHLPKNYKEITILGAGEVTKAQATAFIKMYNNQLPITSTAGQIVDYYYREAGREGIKWDIALCQALLETGFFTFGGTVVPEQNNYCGLGTTNATTRGVYFLTPLEGVRAHIQHLMAYAVVAEPQTKIIDPRYALVHNGKKKNGVFTCWHQLNGKWATGSNYSEKIIDIHEKMKQVIAVSGSEIW